MFGTGFSTQKDPREAGREAARKAVERAKGKPNFALIFCSYSKYPDARPLLEGVKEVLGDIPVYGSSTAGEFVTEGPVKESVVILASACPISYLSVGIGRDIDKDPRRAAKEALSEALYGLPLQYRNLARPVSDFLYNPYTILMTSAIGAEESIIGALKEEVGPTPIVGGTSADDFKLSPPFGYQIANYEVHTRSVVVGMLASKHKIGLGFSHAYKPTNNRGIITKSEGRTLLTIDGRKAAEVYSDWVKVPLKKLNVLAQGLSNPLGVLDASGQFYWIKHPIATTAEGGLSAAATFSEGTSVTLMEATVNDQIESARRAVKQAKEACDGEPVAAIIFHCAGRAAHLGERIEDMFKAIKDELGEIPIIGFNTYGEQAPPLHGSSGHHNLTVPILAIGRREF